jgi:hypothetical protein
MSWRKVLNGKMVQNDWPIDRVTPEGQMKKGPHRPSPSASCYGRSHGDWWGIWTRQLTGTLGPSHLSFTTIDVRTFVSSGVLPWHWMPNGTPSFSSVPRPSPLRGLGWWPLGVAWLVMSFLSRRLYNRILFLLGSIKLHKGAQIYVNLPYWQHSSWSN